MSRARLVAAACAVVGIGLTMVTALHDPARALVGWLAAFGVALGTALGALVLAMVFHVTNARWPAVIRPQLMAIVRVLPALVVVFLPVAFGLRRVFPWASSEHAGPLTEELSRALEHQRLWQTPAFFTGRAVLYFAVWSGLALALGRADRAHAREPSDANASRQKRISGAGLPVVALTMTFASFDWFMAVEPGWVSNMYGVYFFAGGLASALGVLAVLVWRAPDHPGNAEHAHAVGRLLFMSVIFWAYIAFFQLLLVWIANLPREVVFYNTRSEHGWQVLAATLLVGHFVLPFLVLLPRAAKRSASVLAVVGAWLVAMDAVDFAWLVLPRAGGALRALDLAPFLGVGGLVIFAGALLSRRPAAVAPAALEQALRYRSS
ncbi:MAG: hypothetical protein JWP97_1679 [Labilithrix sp.]|nr:hypothetical protein [Labilithrix sp.]